MTFNDLVNRVMKTHGGKSKVKICDVRETVRIIRHEIKKDHEFLKALIK